MTAQSILASPSGLYKSAKTSARPERDFRDALNEAVVIVFFSLGPALGAAIFLMWFGGLAWGLLSSFFH